MNRLVFGLAHFCETHGPRVIFVSEALRSLKDLKAFEEGVSWSSCVACTTISRDTGYYITEDSEASLYYVSSTSSTSTELYKFMNHVALRVTSCDGFKNLCEGQLEGNGGPLIIQDEKLLAQRTVFAYTFSLKDSASRGIKRTYSLFVLFEDRFWLLHHLNLIFTKIETLAKNIQSKVYKTFLSEDIPARKIRPLSELMSDLNAYPRLHQQFVAMFKLLGENFEDIVFSGPSREDVYIDQAKLSCKDIFGDLDRNDREILCYRLITRMGVSVHGTNAKAVSDTISSLEIFTPPYTPSHISVQGSIAVGRIGENSFTDAVLKIADDDKMYSFIIKKNVSLHQLPIFVSKILKIISQTDSETFTRKRIVALREEILGLAKIYSIGYSSRKNKALQSVLSAMNLHSTDEKILQVWSRSLIY